MEMENKDFETLSQIIKAHIDPLNENIKNILASIDIRDKEIHSIQAEYANLDKKVCLIEKEITHSNSRVEKLEEIFNRFKNEITEKIESIRYDLTSFRESIVKAIDDKKLTPKIFLLALLASPALTLLLNNLIDAMKKIKP
jgi:chromosome segregation ATPase